MNSEQDVYIGPRPFASGQTLYGRRREVAEVTSLLISQRLLLLHSPSGAGKTSLILAGLLPRLEKRRFVVPYKYGSDSKDPAVIRLHREVEEGDPAGMNRYKASLFLSLEQIYAPEKRRSLDELESYSIDQYLEEAFPKASLDEGFEPLVLIFDQFEELLTVDVTDNDAKRSFTKELGKALSNEGRWAVFALRDDYIGALEPYLPSFPTRLSASYHLSLLGAEAAKSAIVEPAVHAGVAYESEVVDTVIDDLRMVRVQNINGDFTSKVGLYVEPVHLQVVCQSLWRIKGGSDTITGEHLSQLSQNSDKGVDDVLASYYAHHAGRAAEASGVSERKIRDFFSKRLIGAQKVRRALLVSEAIDAGLSEASLEVLDKAFLIRKESRSGALWYELAHDRLVNPVLSDNTAWRLANLKPFQVQCELWVERGRPLQILLTGEDLDQASEEAEVMVDSLTDDELHFLEHSVKAEKAAKDESLRLGQQERIHKMRRMLLMGGALLIVMGCLTYYSLHQKDLADLHLEKAEILKNRAERGEYSGLISKAQRAWQLGEITNARDYLSAIDNSALAKGWEYAYLQTQVADNDNTFIGHTASVTDVTFRPGTTEFASSSVDFSVLLWSVDSKSPRLKLPKGNDKGHIDWINCVAYSADGKYLFSGASDGRVITWNADTGKLLELRQYGSSVRSVVHDRKRERLYVGYASGIVLAWECGPGATLSDHTEVLRTEGAITELALSPNHSDLAIASKDGSLTVYDLEKKVVSKTFTEHKGPVTCVAYSPNGGKLASGGVDRMLFIRNLKNSGEIVEALRANQCEVTSVQFSPDGENIAGTNKDGILIEWASEPRGISRRQRVHSGACTAIAYYPVRSSNEKEEWGIITAGVDCVLRSSCGRAHSLVPTLSEHTGTVWSVDIRRDNRYFVSGSEDKSVRLWERSDQSVCGWKSLPPLLGHTAEVWVVKFSPDGKLVASAGVDGMLKVWDVEKRKLVWSTKALYQEVVSLCFTDDGEVIYVSGVGPEIAGYRATDGERVTTLTIKPGQKVKTVNLKRRQEPLSGFNGERLWISCVDVTNDGKYLAASSSDKKTYIFDLSSSSLLKEIDGFNEVVHSCEFSPDGSLLATGDNATKIKLWDTNSWEVRHTLLGHTAWVTTVAFSPDGKQLVSGSEDNTIRVWDVNSGYETITMSEHNDTVWRAVFDREGKIILSGSKDWTLKVWDANRKKLDHE